VRSAHKLRDKRSVLSEGPVHRVRGGVELAVEHVGVGVHREPERRMPEHLHHGPQVDALGDEVRPAGVAEIVQVQPVEPGLVPDLVEATAQA
jgi:hypothetical protein